MKGHLSARVGRRAIIDAHPPTWMVAVVCLGTTLLIAVGDYLTGPYLVFATFYLLPVVVASWYLGRTAGLVAGLLAALSGAVSTAIDPRDVTSPVIVSNGVLRFVTYALIAALTSAERDALLALSRLASTDGLTGLVNRRTFYEIVERELARARRSPQSRLAVVYIDVDELKFRNDTYGHEAGDAMLVEFAEIARRTMRSIDTVARVGGDEFCILLPETVVGDAEAAVQRLLDNLAQAELLPIRVSAGIVSGPVADEIDVETIVHAADELMLEAKRSGKGQYRSQAWLRTAPPETAAGAA
jgi:diguanylate cyclase (GGDEF)-like protein